MARNMSNMPMMQPRQELTPRPKLKAPDVFDGTSAQKLDPFLVQCMMYISLWPHKFTTKDSKVSFIMSYLSGSPYNWFQSQITAALKTGMTQPLPWLLDVALFIQELKQLFGPQDPVADAYVGRTGWNERALYHQYYKGLPNRIKDKFPQLDHCYWEHQNKINHEKRKDNTNSKSGTSNNNSSNNSGSSNSKGNSAGSSSGSGSSNSKSGSNSSNNSKDKDKSKSKGSSSDKPNPLADKLGADGKLKPKKRERRSREASASSVAKLAMLLLTVTSITPPKVVPHLLQPLLLTPLPHLPLRLRRTLSPEQQKSKQPSAFGIARGLWLLSQCPQRSSP
ncbi:unnamed protein product [Cyclocybe aegerita]|uniref:DUF4939 domain-containing protein n=1 Tax=Cyclocybe aegerita TaxID=1973307 RepID=A0A8S0WLW7_CYCAE|nr:unnamed protein product [Cyclocybe aegerita]